GWLIADLLLVWPVSVTVDFLSGNWKSFSDLDAMSLSGPVSGAATAGASLGGPAPPAFEPRKTEPGASLAPAPAPAPPPTASGKRAVIERGKLAVLDFHNYSK